MVTLLGGTGILGRLSAIALAKRGFSVRVVGRHASARPWPAWPQIHGVAADIRNPASLARALQGSHSVHVGLANGLMPANEDGFETQALKRVIEIGKHSNWSCLTFHSASWVNQTHAGQPLARGKWESEEALRWSGLPFVIIRSGLAMETLPRFVYQNRVRIMNRHAQTFRLTAGKDIAALISHIHTEGDILDKTLYACGPEALTLKSSLIRYCTGLQPLVKVKSLPRWLLAWSAGRRGPADWRDIVSFLNFLEKVGEAPNQPDGFTLMGLTPMNLHAWCKEKSQSSKDLSGLYRRDHSNLTSI